jgi:hypothetical protein
VGREEAGHGGSAHQLGAATAGALETAGEIAVNAAKMIAIAIAIATLREFFSAMIISLALWWLPRSCEGSIHQSS